MSLVVYKASLAKQIVDGKDIARVDEMLERSKLGKATRKVAGDLALDHRP